MTPATEESKVIPVIFVVPEYLTVTSSGPAGVEQYDMMGVYRQTGETHNKKPVWSRVQGPGIWDQGPEEIYYSNGKFLL